MQRNHSSQMMRRTKLEGLWGDRRGHKCCFPEAKRRQASRGLVMLQKIYGVELLTLINTELRTMDHCTWIKIGVYNSLICLDSRG